MKKYYYITPEKEQRGPVEAAMLASCGVDSNTMVWTEGMSNWQPAGEIPDLAFFIITAPTPPPFNSTSQQADGSQQQYGPEQYQQASGATGNASEPNTGQGYDPSVGQGMNNDMGMPPAMPDNNLVWAILSTIFCCLPLGVVSIVYASRVNSLYMSRDYIGAQQAADNAKNWALYSMLASVVVNVIMWGLAFTVFSSSGVNIADILGSM